MSQTAPQQDSKTALLPEDGENAFAASRLAGVPAELAAQNLCGLALGRQGGLASSSLVEHASPRWGIGCSGKLCQIGDFAADQADILELAIAHGEELVDRRAFDAP